MSDRADTSTRADGRAAGDLRPVIISPHYLAHTDGSALIEWGDTRVLCVATVTDGVPDWLEGRGSGWVTAQYALLPYATRPRHGRETDGLSGRTQEIRRLIGRSLRAAVSLPLLGERTVIVDCDVLEADGGTRTASVTGGYVALALALEKAIARGDLSANVLLSPLAAVSVGLQGRCTMLDLCYAEDSSADVDLNLVMNARGEYIELQGTAEGQAYTREALDEMLDLGWEGIRSLLALQQECLT